MEDKYIVGIVIAAVAVLVGLALWPAFAGNVGTMTQTSSSANVSYTLPANGSTADLTPCYQDNTSAVVIYSDAGDYVLPSANYSVAQAAGTDGFLHARITLININSTYAETAMNVSCSYEPLGYIEDSGSRGIVALIAIFMALLIAFAAFPNFRESVLNVFKK
ncbi:MAG: hypothetical protein JSW08_00100 [archaeon]|nr:MAG: hypothetical protein JSW08_00100 [archaeon]